MTSLLTENAAAVVPPTEYRSKQFTAIPDVGASVRKWGGAREEPASTLIPAFLDHVITPRVSLFTLLVSDLALPFSLDNGMALQTMVNHWLQCFRAPKRARSGTPCSDAVMALKRNRQARAVWWEARVVRIWTWPAEDGAALLRMARAVLEAIIATGTPEGGGCTSSTHVITDTAEICAACTHRMYAELTVDYKCATLVA